LGSSPYSTGGGGVKLEHAYAGSVLATLLLGQPVEGLGDEYTPTEVGLQQEVESRVDDLVVVGTSPGGRRTLRVACRRRPVLGSSSESTVKLFLDYLWVLVTEPTDLATGRLRLGLAVSGPFGPAAEVSELAEVARSQGSNEAFRRAIEYPGAHSADVRGRLGNIDDIVTAALGLKGAPDVAGEDPHVLSWRLLASLYVIQLQLEGDVAPGRTQTVGRLQALTGSAERAGDLLRQLDDLASVYAIRAGRINRSMLRRDLRAFGPLGAAAGFETALDALNALERQLRREVHGALPNPGNPLFTLDRSSLIADLTATISKAVAPGVVLVHGEPDVGKSALALAVVDTIREAGGTAIALSLRDLPNSLLDLNSRLGCTLEAMFGAVPSAPIHVLLLDGAEAVQEGQGQTLGALLEAALPAGLIPIVVVRDDAAGTIRDQLARAGGTVTEFVVPALSDIEVDTLVTAISPLARLAADQRSKWLLRRLGLVELLLQTAANGAALPETLSSEAEVFATVWSALVRNREIVVNGIGPDARADAAVEAARRLVSRQGSVADGPALAALRSDGILAQRHRLTAWAADDSGFTSDVLRDFATAALLQRDGLQVLTNSTGPRWAVRATRVYCQARLSHAVRTGPTALAEAWTELRSEIHTLAAVHGARWAELPWEALLTAGWAAKALDALTPQLTSDTELRSEAMRCLKLRFSEGERCDPLVGSPLVAWLLDNTAALGEPERHVNDVVDKLNLSWLRGVASAEIGDGDIADHRPLRARLRAYLLGRKPEPGDDELLESLALLGSDSDEASVSLLRNVARDRPAFLAKVVESFSVALLLARQNPALLAELAEAYYIEKPAAEGHWGHSMFGDGIRRHRGTGFGEPMAGWYHGPFWILLQDDPGSGLALINRMLDHAARCRATSAKDHGTEVQDHDEGTDDPTVLDLVGMGPRPFIGDENAWAWYRGSTVGPYPCMSALLALERLADASISAGAPIGTVAKILLRGATTLATPGLVLGLLARHLEVITDELDGFLSDPNVWVLEFNRVSVEGGIHVQGPDPALLPGRERRRWTLREVATNLIISAAKRNDTAALDRLRALGDNLIAAAGGDEAPPQVRQWAAHLDWNSYAAHSADGGLVVEVNVPDDVAQALAPAHEYSTHLTEMYRLQNRYRINSTTPHQPALAAAPAPAELKSDIQVAQGLARMLTAEPLDMVRTALAGVAASVVHEPAADIADTSWAVALLVNSALHPYLGNPIPQAIHPNGADRQAALALPRALYLAKARTNTQGSARLQADQLGDALRASTASLFDEVRHNAAEGLRSIWSLPCETAEEGGHCHHQIAWQAVEVGARAVVLGPVSANGRRQPESVIGDLKSALHSRPDQDLMLSSIGPAATSVLECIAANCCVSEIAQDLRPTILSAYVRAARHWSIQGYEWRTEKHAALTATLLRWTTAYDRALLVELATDLSAAPGALAEFLHALAFAATYDHSLIEPLGQVWPDLMEIGLAAASVAGSDWRATEKLIANLVPDPTVAPWLDGITATLDAVRGRWVSIEQVHEQIELWLRHARAEQACIDALIGFLKTQPAAAQADRGLPWVRSITVRPDGSAYTCGFLLVGWLEQLRDWGVIGSARRPDYRAIVDALVLGNYAGARALQQAEE
jgi:hypothetical protein